MKVLLFDNYDSFTYNLLHILKELGVDVEVHRNDKISLDEVERFDKILLSPGPGIPEEAGILLPLIRRYAPTKSILGVWNPVSVPVATIRGSSQKKIFPTAWRSRRKIQKKDRSWHSAIANMMFAASSSTRNPY